MNDLEARLRRLNFREPPPGLRGSVLAAASEKSERAGWLGPSPMAWAALAAVWLILLALDRALDRSAPAPRAVAAEVIAPPSSPPALLVLRVRAAIGEPPL